MKKLTSSIVIALLTLSSCVNKSAMQDPVRIPLYEMEEAGSKYYRIPALTQAVDGALVAIADKRGDALGDLPNIISIVSKRSTDGGKTWSDMSIVAQGDTVAKCGYGDAVVIADEKRGNLVAVYSGNNGLWQSNEESLIRTYTSISTDNGKTWGAVTDITDQVYGGVYGEGTRYGLFTGSGSGVQLKHGKHAGRIMLVVAARNDATWGGTMSNYAIYSDDGGITWHASKNPGCTDGDESKVVELSNGDVLMSIRNRHKGDRLFSISTDGGETWSEPKYNATLPAPACNGDIVAYTHNGKNLLLHSLPASRTTRENVTVYVSEDNGETWTAKRCIYKGYSAYSSLQVLDDGTIGIIVEEGKWDGGLPGEDGFNLGYYHFTLDWLMAGDKQEQ
ncbi:MAG: exo-alpha-sialidase [Bacteroides sp.]|nr:exo-alpha-sialidase [Bacteroides sp.]